MQLYNRQVNGCTWTRVKSRLCYIIIDIKYQKGKNTNAISICRNLLI